MKFIGGVAMVAALIMLAGCGGAPGPSAGAETSAAKATAGKAGKAREHAAARRKAKQSAVYKQCETAAGLLDENLTELDSRLSAGLTFDKYSSAVGSAKAASDRFMRDAKARGGIGDQCITKVGGPLESALNTYISADTTWNGCIRDTDCSFGKGTASEKKVEAKWAQAGHLVMRADAALTKMAPQ